MDLGDPQAVRLAIGDIVNRLYGTSIFATPTAASIIASSIPLARSATSGKAEAPVEKQQVPVAAPSTSKASAGGGADSHVSHPAGHAPHTVPAKHFVPPNCGLYEWTARIEFKKYELGCSFAVLLFLGEVPDDPEEWQVSPNYVGGHHAFVNGSASQCSNCRSQADVVVEGFVHLNKGIVTHSGLNSLEPSVVEPYLKENLHWRVQKVMVAFVFRAIGVELIAFFLYRSVAILRLSPRLRFVCTSRLCLTPLVLCSLFLVNVVVAMA